MITVNIKGGLGNQMFQYACGRALALRNNDRLSLIRTRYHGDSARDLSLTRFDIQADWPDRPGVSIWQQWRERWRQKFTGDFHVGFDPQTLTRSGNVYLDGYFQSELYFKDQAEHIRADLHLKTALGEKASSLAELIKNDRDAVSIHVRRGDYVNHPDFGGVCTPEYYDRAVVFLKQRLLKANFYVFSDDIEWCRTGLPCLREATFVSGPKLRDFEEMFLMSICRHHIIANSSFSWWGAWLGNNPSKIVVAPKRWSNLHEEWYRDIIPSTWKRM